MLAYVGSGWTDSGTTPPQVGISISAIETGGAKTSEQLYLYDRGLWNISPTGPNGQSAPEIGSWKLSQAEARYIDWTDMAMRHIHAYILAPDGTAYWLQCFAPQAEIAAKKPIFQSIT